MGIRAGRLDADVPACVALWLSAVAARDGAIPDPPALAARMTAKFDQPILRFAVAGRGGDIGSGAQPGPIDGFALTVRRPSGPVGAFLELLAVAADRAGHGLGRALLDDALAAAERSGGIGLDLLVREGNARALALYRSAGFVPIGDPVPHSDGGAPMITLTNRP